MHNEGTSESTNTETSISVMEEEGILTDMIRNNSFDNQKIEFSKKFRAILKVEKDLCCISNILISIFSILRHCRYDQEEYFKYITYYIPSSNVSITKYYNFSKGTN